MRIMVIDDHVLFREGLISLLEDQADMDVIGEASSANEGVEKALDLNPDVILMDFDLVDGDALEATKQILSQQPDTAIVMLTTIDSDELLFNALHHGAKGYLLKKISKSKLLASLRALERGEVALSRRMMSKVLVEFSRIAKLQSNGHTDIDILSYRELEVLKCLSANLTNREVAERLCISVNTVRVHVHNILDKLGMRNRREAGDFARRLGIRDQ